MPRPSHLHIGRALCAVAAEYCLLFYKSPQNGKSVAWPQPPVQAPPHLLHTTETAYDLAVPHGIPRAGHSHTGRALCAVVAESCLLLWKSTEIGKTAIPTNHLSSPAAAPSAGSPPHLLHTAEAASDFGVPNYMPRRTGHSHTGRALCAVVAECCLLLWKPPQTGKTATPTNHLLPSPGAAPSAGSTTPAEHCRGCIWP